MVTLTWLNTSDSVDLKEHEWFMQEREKSHSEWGLDCMHMEEMWAREMQWSYNQHENNTSYL